MSRAGARVVWDLVDLKERSAYLGGAESVELSEEAGLGCRGNGVLQG